MEAAAATQAEGEASAGGGLTDEVIAAVTSHIRTNHLAPGDRLPSETALATQLGVSRTVVREAFGSMAALRLIDVGNGRRARVSAIDRSVLALVLDHAVQTDQISVQQILDVRRTIELRTAALAALRRDAQDANAILALAAAMRADFADAPRVMEHDIAFHEAIARTSKNPMFALVVGSFHVITRQTWPIGWNSRASDVDRMAAVAGHEAIAAAIAAGNPRAAETAMAEHFDYSVKALLAAGVT